MLTRRKSWTGTRTQGKRRFAPHTIPALWSINVITRWPILIRNAKGSTSALGAENINKVRNLGCNEDNGGKDREKQQSSKEKVAVK